MPTKTAWVFIALFVVVIVIVALGSSSLVEGYPYQANMALAATNTLIALIAVTLFVERGMTVVNAMLYGEEQRQVEVGLADGNKSLDDLAKVLGAKERVRLLGGFIAALFVSAAGVRTLEGLVNTKVAPHSHNAYLIPVDVVLTAALIAGGSNGLAYLLQIAKERLAAGTSIPSSGVTTATPSPTPTPTPTGRGLTAGGSGSGIDPALRARLITAG
jgi:hypothetical protein